MSIGLTAMIGLPGSGKSTLAGQLQRETPGAIVLTADAIRTEGADMRGEFFRMHKYLREYLAGGHHAIVDACNLRSAERRRLLRMAALFDAPTRAILVFTPLGVCKARRSLDASMREYDWDEAVRRRQYAQLHLTQEGWHRVETMNGWD